MYVYMYMKKPALCICRMNSSVRALPLSASSKIVRPQTQNLILPSLNAKGLSQYTVHAWFQHSTMHSLSISYDEHNKQQSDVKYL